MVVSIIDYGMGNIKSVSNALDYLGAKNQVVERPAELEGDKIIIPGVGAFGDAMKNLNSFTPKIEEAFTLGKPILGICIGMQILFDESEESPHIGGLSVLAGSVEKVKTNLKLPHIGWNWLKIENAKCPLFEGVPEGYVYYAHSYHARPEKEITVATSDYAGDITAAVWNRENIYGVQFHPEKSGKMGLKLLKNFLSV